MTKINYFEGAEAKLLNDKLGNNYATIIGIPNAVSLIYNTECGWISSLIRSTDLSDPEDLIVWSFNDATSFRVGKNRIEMETSEFLDWLGEHYPEDLEMMLFHPEIFKDRFDVL